MTNLKDWWFTSKILCISVLLCTLLSPCWNTMFSLSWNMGSQFEEGVPFEWVHTRSGENMVSHRFLLQLNYVVKVPLASKFELTCG